MVNVKNIALAGAALLGFAQAVPFPFTSSHLTRSTVVKDGYIIKLKPGAQDFDTHVSWVEGVHKRNLAKRSLYDRAHKGIDRKFTGGGHWHGYSGEFDEATIAEIEASSDVAYIEKDQQWEIDHIQGDVSLLNKRDLTTQEGASWGLGAISHRKPGSKEYIHEANAGEGTHAYVVDTGIKISHDEFEGRAKRIFTAFEGEEEDEEGHGTHVAGTIVGKTYGVAKRANVYAVKVFQGQQSTTSTIVAGVDAAIDHIIKHNRKDTSVINMSLGGQKSDMLDDALKDATSQGIAVVVAAGNQRMDVAEASPARVASSITVGAVNNKFDRWIDNRTTAIGSNIGGEMDLWGPGQDVISAGIESDTAFDVLTGTSMACPHVAGLVLYAMSVDGVSGVKPITQHLIDNATPGVVGGPISDSPNLLANNGNKQQEQGKQQ